MIYPHPKPTPKAKAPKRLGRSKPINKRRTKPRRSGRGAPETAYMLAVKQLTCRLALWDPCHHQCDGYPEADHAGERPKGRKAPDNTCIAMCPSAHRQRTDYTGFFKGWTGAHMRVWCDEQIRLTQTRLGYPERWREAA